MAPPRAADDFETIRERMKELRRAGSSKIIDQRGEAELAANIAEAAHQESPLVQARAAARSLAQSGFNEIAFRCADGPNRAVRSSRNLRIIIFGRRTGALPPQLFHARPDRWEIVGGAGAFNILGVGAMTAAVRG